METPISSIEPKEELHLSVQVSKDLHHFETLEFSFSFFEKAMPQEIPALSDHEIMAMLDIRGNRLRHLPSMANLPNLRLLEASDNRLSTLPEMKGVEFLNTICLGNNELTDLSVLASLDLLRAVGCRGNALNKLPQLPQFYMACDCCQDAPDHNRSALLDWCYREPLRKETKVKSWLVALSFSLLPRQ